MAAPAPAIEDRTAWANRMRLLLSPKGSVNDDGSIKQEFFKPKKARRSRTPPRAKLRGSAPRAHGRGRARWCS
jgi:hypothetical protein